ncbi:hypothetical protein [uncultured Halomonas sp.]|uniref:hypothetical protein n=1 Tax=uncultured Halomonas sp. TaxID=173971 RepID=UPI002613118F|nr:hypothetical protein [uncultured Halomonas sp.]
MSTWSDVMAMKANDTRHYPKPSEVANNLSDSEILTITATMEFFGATDEDIQQTLFDLSLARFRIFDWLAMAVMGRIDCKPAVKVLVHSFLKVNGDVDKFITDLCETDYQIDLTWEGVDLDD